MKNLFEEAYFGSAKLLTVSQFDTYYQRVRGYVEGFRSDENLSSLVASFLNACDGFSKTMTLFAGGTPAQKADKQFLSCVGDWRGVRHIITALLSSSDSSVKKSGELAYDAYKLVVKKDSILHTTILSKVSLFEKTLVDGLEQSFYVASGLKLAMDTLVADVKSFSALAKVATDYKADANRVTITSAKELVQQSASDLMMGFATFNTIVGDVSYQDVLDQLIQLKLEFSTVLKVQQAAAKKAQEKAASSSVSSDKVEVADTEKPTPAMEMTAELAYDMFKWQDKMNELERLLREHCDQYHIDDEEGADVKESVTEVSSSVDSDKKV